MASLTETSPESIVNSITNSLQENTQAAADRVVEDTKAAANQAVEDTKAAADKAVEDTKNAAKEKAGKSIDDAASKAKNALGLNRPQRGQIPQRRGSPLRLMDTTPTPPP